MKNNGKIKMEDKINEIKQMLNELVGVEYNLRLEINHNYFHLEFDYTNPYDDEEYLENFNNYESLDDLFDDFIKYIQNKDD